MPLAAKRQPRHMPKISIQPYMELFISLVLRVCGRMEIIMISYFSELRYKEVIDVCSGFRLGYVCDAEFDDAEGRLISLITPGRAKLFGLMGREDDYVIPWGCIARIGSDIILVDAKDPLPRRKRKRQSFL